MIFDLKQLDLTDPVEFIVSKVVVPIEIPNQVISPIWNDRNVSKTKRSK